VAIIASSSRERGFTTTGFRLSKRSSWGTPPASRKHSESPHMREARSWRGQRRVLRKRENPKSITRRTTLADPARVLALARPKSTWACCPGRVSKRTVALRDSSSLISATLRLTTE